MSSFEVIFVVLSTLKSTVALLFGDLNQSFPKGHR